MGSDYTPRRWCAIGIEKKNGDAILTVLNGRPTAWNGGGTTPNQIAQTAALQYGQRLPGATSAMLAWFTDQELHGQWTAHDGKANEQTTSSHDQLWQQAVWSALWWAIERKDTIVQQAVEQWVVRYTACNCAGELADGRVVLPGARVTLERPTSSYRDETHRLIRGFESPRGGKDWPLYRDQIGPCLTRKLLKRGYGFGGAVKVTPLNCADRLPRLVNVMRVTRYQNGHIGRTDGEWPSGIDYCRVAWAQGPSLGFDTPPPTTGWVEPSAEIVTPPLP